MLVRDTRTNGGSYGGKRHENGWKKLLLQYSANENSGGDSGRQSAREVQVDSEHKEPNRDQYSQFRELVELLARLLLRLVVCELLADAGIRDAEQLPELRME